MSQQLIEDIKEYLEDRGFEIQDDSPEQVNAVLAGSRASWKIHVAADNQAPQSLPDPNADKINSNTLPKGSMQHVVNPVPVAPEQLKLDLTWEPKKEEKKSEEKKPDKKDEKKADHKDEKPAADKKDEKKAPKKSEEGEEKKEPEAYTRSFVFSDFTSFRAAMNCGVLDTITEHVSEDEEASDEEVKTALCQLSLAEIPTSIAFLANVLHRQMGVKK